MQRLPIVDRIDELELISDIVLGRSAPTGVVIVRPAGVGKIRLADEATAACPPRSVVTLVGTPAAQAVPLAPLLSMLHPDGR